MHARLRFQSAFALVIRGKSTARLHSSQDNHLYTCKRLISRASPTTSVTKVQQSNSGTSEDLQLVGANGTAKCHERVAGRLPSDWLDHRSLLTCGLRTQHEHETMFRGQEGLSPPEDLDIIEYQSGGAVESQLCPRLDPQIRCIGRNCLALSVTAKCVFNLCRVPMLPQS